MLWEKFAILFDESWHVKIKPFIESEECDRIYAFLKHESMRGKKIAPLSSHVFRCFKETKYDELKVIFMGFSPYPTFMNKVPIADGLLMSCSITDVPQPSLIEFYKTLNKELNTGRTTKRHNDLSYLAKQGVLLFNSSLTCEQNKAGSHCELWKPFTVYLMENVFTTGAPIIFLGKEAAKFKEYIFPFTWSFELSHPAYAARSGVEWETDNIFLKINKILKDNNNYKIEWL